jgi:hypothetical protein
MTITLHISPQVEGFLQVQARERGMTVDAYVQSMIESVAVRQPLCVLSQAEYEAKLDELSANSDNWPILPIEACNREGIYRDG